MNGGALPLVLMFAAVGLALMSVAPKAAWLSIACLSLSTLLFAMFEPSEAMQSALFAGFWLSLMATAATVLFGRSLPALVAAALAVNAGAWSGLLAALTHSRTTLIFALPISLLFVTSRWLKPSYGVVTKVLSSWLIAVGTLAMLVSMVPTPGYEADHME